MWKWLRVNDEGCHVQGTKIFDYNNTVCFLTLWDKYACTRAI